MRIGYYFPAKHLGGWVLSGGFNRHLALSGTDRSSLWLADSLINAGHEVVFLSENLPSAGWRGKSISAESFAQAANLASGDGCAVLVTCAHGDEPTLAGVREAEQREVATVIWDHNGPSGALALGCSGSSTVRSVVCVSHLQADEVRHRALFRKISVVHNPMDLEFWSPGLGKRETAVVVYVGSLTPAKGFHHLAAAWPQVLRRYPRAQLHVCGSALLYNRDARLGPLGVAEASYENFGIIPFLGATREQAAQLGVNFEGLTAPEVTRALLRRSAVGVVNPNVSSSCETFCVSAVEMQACGLPVVGGRAGGLEETVAHGRTGLLVKRPTELAAALCRLLADADLRAQMAEQGPVVAKRFAPEIILQQWNGLLQAAEQRRALPRLAFARKPMRWRRYVKRAIQALSLQWVCERRKA